MFLGYIHSFRALAIIFIIAMHCIDVFQWNDEVVEKLFRITISNGTILFVFIAGYLFQHLSPKFVYKKYLITKLRHVIIPYLLVSIPAILIFTTVLERDTVWDGFYNAPIWIQVCNFYLTGLHLAPFWFIPVISIYYVLSFLLVKLDQTKWFYFLLPLFIWLSSLVGRGVAEPFLGFIHLFSAYACGMFFSHYKSTLNIWIGKTWVIFVVALVVVSLWLYEFYFEDKTYTYVNYLQKLCLSVFVLGALVRIGQRATHHYINLIADLSFGIFFVHSYFLTSIKLVFVKMFGSLPEGSLLAFFIAMLITLLSCMIIVFAIKKIAGSKSRIVIGS